MLTVYNCIVNEHDLRLVLLAAAVCAIASFSAIKLLQHVMRSHSTGQTFWLAVAATSTGFGIWATHFIAMLAFSPSIPSAYDGGFTALSLILAVLLTGVGMRAATRHGDLENRLVGGAIIGGGIAAMHFVGMAAFEIQGHITWSPPLVTLALGSGLALGAASIAVALERPSRRATAVAATLMTLAICALHFIAMAAASITPDAAVEISSYSVDPTTLAAAVAAVSLAILCLSGAALWVDLRFRQNRLEATRMHGLANAAVEGLVICDGERVVSANDSVLELTGLDRDAIAGLSLGDLFGSSSDFDRLDQWGATMREAELKAADGTAIPVELLAREIDYCGKPHMVLAVRDVRERKKAEADIMRLAHFDPLTGLPNRRSFTAKLDAEIAAMPEGEGRQVALLLLDLDRFKEVNDQFGHGAGDTMLQTVARCVSGRLRAGQMMARLGGDEFAVILPNLSDGSAAERVARSILQALREENRHRAGEGVISTSIGIALYPADAPDKTTLISYADTALYRAKADGKDTYRFFEASMGAEARDRRALEHELRQALTTGEFSLVYQPQMEISSGRMIGFEALIRWNHPRRGLLAPAQFVPIAEESGLIVPIGEWVLATACREAVSWQQSLTVAVNVSPIQLHNPNFTQRLHEILLQTGLPPQRLELEVTETALIKDMHRALAVLRQVKALGVRLAMDDFGTGYSSLSNLRAFPFDKIKIDSSFIKSVDKNEQVAAIVRAVLGLGRGLGLPVLAEGIESSDELAFLGAEACQIGQGYFIGRPGPIGDFSTITGNAAPAAKNEADKPLRTQLA
ncbi:PAS domain S-box-containing protein/diguanylate cyclase (GGDEF)-like protein [Pseudaminobacter salicylatoxidans]|uniref:PAS domain S-box-containing protein/diguanylate cyclase (GGDEF)-like protein n=1 Tax=Pseudaminobacter salicylatoxidans TaxID=93369 RepID=A0A316C6X5_PSESE|nr:bifunctional diguanylate cyclase/phosphodiesterase [Pseudaminobacter salicylatoxidans]PWJ84806.1 PAS domain S-box-containing protein/diguanylate cyclase (GGDEF)-like protein [Pseudaminobacter salicylatoxidans]